MKTWIMLIIAGTISSHCQGQKVKEWAQQKKTQKEYLIQQIAALQLYLGQLKKGYEIVNRGLNLIGDIKEGKFKLDKTYVSSLDAVNPEIGHSAKVAYIMATHRLIDKDIQQLYEIMGVDENLTPDERGYLSAVYAQLLDESDGLWKNLMQVATSNELQMQDEQRLARIDQVLDEMQNLYAFTRYFGNSTQLLLLQRYRAQNDVTTMQRLHQLQP